MLDDTHPVIRARLIEGIRQTPPWQRLAALERSRRIMRQWMLGQLRQSHPHLTARERQWAVAEKWLGSALFSQVRDRLTLWETPLPSEDIAALKAVCIALDRIGVRYAIGGSVASSVYGERRFTNDVDILADLAESDVEPLARALGDAFYADVEMMKDAVSRGECFNVLDLLTQDKIDFFVESSDFSESELSRAVSIPFGDEDNAPRLRFVTPEDAILSKLRWYRLGNEVSERQWTDVLGVLRVQGNNLARRYLYEWADRLGVRDLLDRCIAEAGLASEP